MSLNKKMDKIPVILYEESLNGSWESSIPYIEVQENETMPSALFIQEYRFTGETEPDHEGNEAPCYDAYMHMYLNMEELKKKLDPKLLDQVRKALGMKPLKTARAEGSKILSAAVENTNTKIAGTFADQTEERRAKAHEAADKLLRRLGTIEGDKK